MSIPFTQYLRPNGTRKSVTTDRPGDIEKKAFKVISAGGEFEIEELTTGQVSITCVYDDDDIVVEVVPNGPEVPSAVDKVVEKAYDYVVTGRMNV